MEAREFRPILGGDYPLTVRFESLDSQGILISGDHFRISYGQQLWFQGTAPSIVWITGRNTPGSSPFAEQKLS